MFVFNSRWTIRLTQKRISATKQNAFPSLFVHVAHCFSAPFFLVFFLNEIVCLMLRFQKSTKLLAMIRPIRPASREHGPRLGRTRTDGHRINQFDLMIVDTGYMDTNWTNCLCDSDFITTAFGCNKAPLNSFPNPYALPFWLNLRQQVVDKP